MAKIRERQTRWQPIRPFVENLKRLVPENKIIIIAGLQPDFAQTIRIPHHVFRNGLVGFNPETARAYVLAEFTERRSGFVGDVPGIMETFMFPVNSPEFAQFQRIISPHREAELRRFINIRRLPEGMYEGDKRDLEDGVLSGLDSFYQDPQYHEFAQQIGRKLLAQYFGEALATTMYPLLTETIDEIANGFRPYLSPDPFEMVDGFGFGSGMPFQAFILSWLLEQVQYDRNYYKFGDSEQQHVVLPREIIEQLEPNWEANNLGWLRGHLIGPQGM